MTEKEFERKIVADNLSLLNSGKSKVINVIKENQAKEIQYRCKYKTKIVKHNDYCYYVIVF